MYKRSICLIEPHPLPCECKLRTFMAPHPPPPEPRLGTLMGPHPPPEPRLGKLM